MGHKTNNQLRQEIAALRQRNCELEKIATDYQTILNNNQLSAILISPDLSIRAFNDLAKRNAQRVFRKEMAPGSSILQFVREADLQSFQTHFKQALAGEIVTIEKSFKIDDNEFWFEHDFYPVRAEDSVTGICFTSLEITERKQAESKHLASEKKFKTLFEMSADAILLADAGTGLIVDANSATAKLFEKPVREIQGMHQQDLHPPEQLEKAQKTFAYRSPIFDDDAPPVEIEILTTNNHRKSVEIRGRVIQLQGQEFILGNFRDVTDRKLAEEALQKSEANLRAILKNTNDFICARDRDCKLTFFNQAFAKLVKKVFNVAATVGLNTLDYLPENERKRWEEIISDVLSGKRHREAFSWNFENGEVRYYEIAFNPIRQEKEIIGFTEFTRDITERTRSRKAIEASEIRFRQVLEGAFSGAYSRNLTTDTYDYLSPTFKQLTGYEPETLSRMPIDTYLAHIHPEDVEKAAEIVETSKKADKNPYRIEYRFRHQDGKYRWFADLFNVKLDENGLPHCRYGNVQDITKQKETEAQILASENKFKSIIHKSPVGIGLVDSQGIIFECNQAIADMIGYSRDELNGISFEKFTHPDDLEREWQLINQLWENQTVEYRMEKRYIHKNGQTIWVDVAASIVKDQNNNLEFGFAFVQNITPRKKMEMKLQQRERQLKQVIDTTPNAIAVKDREGKFLLVNQSTARLHQSTVAELTGKREVDLVAKDLKPDEIEAFLRDDREVIETGKPKVIQSEPFTMPDGTVKYFMTQKVPFELTNQKKGVLVVATDITEQKKVEMALQTSEERFNLAVQGTRDGLCDWNLQTDSFYHSEQFAKILGYDNEALPTTSDACFNLIHPDDKEMVMQSIQAFLANGDEIFEKTFRMRKKSGEYCWITFRGSAVKDASGKACRFIGFLTDITERKNLEEQLRQSQKMEAIGKLAGGIAHDFNNLLTVINGYTDILLADMASTQSEFEDLQQIKRAGARAASLTNQLLAFSRKQVLRLEILNVNDLIENLEPMLRRLIDEDIELITYLEKDLAKVKVDRGRFEQIIINLVVNARDAMPSGGKLIVRTRNVWLDEAYAAKHPDVKPGPYILIAVADNGKGIDQQTQEHIFEPFFTTKAVGKGTGLGLSTVYGIIKQSNGDIWLHSEPGKGTTFYIHLPAIAEMKSEAQQNTISSRKLIGTETILVVEDEKSVLNLVQKTLTRMGYQLITASNGEQALETIKNFHQPIHLLLSDVVMPNMSGKELAEKIREQHPATKVCFMSGYTDDAIIRHGVLDARIHFIQKPFSPEFLARRVREILDEN